MTYLTTNGERATPALLAYQASDVHTHRIHLDAVYLTEAQQVRNFGFIEELRDFEVVLTVHFSHPHLPSWEPVFRIWHHYLNRHDAERISRVLRKVDHGLERLRERQGFPDTFGEYVVRVARILGIRHVLHQTDGHGPHYDDNRYAVLSLDDSRTYLNTLLADWQQAHPRPHTAAS